ncbi:hypothetical protein KKF84_13070 [Myxococcota bacterium]|nr:hypothetical protein [Myxococcota bacterium]MBU1536249.1 hypothetical protein [Myxococcota bacterium]
MKHRLLLLLIVSLNWVISCATETPGIDPPDDTFFYPSGILYHEDTGTLFVTNGNSDLKYNGSTILALDMDMILSAVKEPLSHDNCLEDSENPGEFLCSITDDMVRHAVRLGSYAGDMVLFPHPDAGGENLFRLMVAVRGDPSLTWLDVKGSGGAVTCMDCGEGCTGSYPNDCNGSHRITTGEGLLSDPFRLLSFSRTHGVNGIYNFIIATHLSEGGVTMVDVTADPIFVSHILVDQFTPANAGSGTFESVMATADASDLYISNAVAPEIQRFNIRYSADNLTYVLVPDGFYFFQAPFGPMEIGAEIRGMAFSEDKSRLYAAVRTPPMLYALDTYPDEQGRPSLDLLSYTELPAKPSIVKTYSGFGDRELVFVVSYPEGELVIIDALYGNIIQRVSVGAGPHDFLIVDSEQFRGIITLNFGESTIGFIAFDGTTFRRVGRLGEPTSIN